MLCMLALALAPQLDQTWSNGVLGSQLDVALQGDAGDFVLWLPSFGPGPTPLSAIEPADPRVLDVGLDALPYLQVALLNGNGAASLTLPLPALAPLSGLELHAQAVSVGPLPPQSPLFEELSNAIRFTLAAPREFHRTPGDMLAPRRMHTATRLPDGSVLLAGGEVPAAAPGVWVVIDATERFDPLRQEFIPSPLMPERRSRHTATQLADGRVLLLGGIGPSGAPLASATIYDPATDTFTSVAPMSTARVHHQAVLLADGRVFVSGGTAGPYTASHSRGYPASFGASSPLASTELFSPTGGAWVPGPSLPSPRFLHQATRIGALRVLVTGGLEPSGPTVAATASASIFDGASLAITPTTSMPSARAFHGSVPRASGGAFITGGGTVATMPALVVDGTSQAAIVYDVPSMAWGLVGNTPILLMSPRIHCIPLDNGCFRYIASDCPDRDVRAPLASPFASVDSWIDCSGMPMLNDPFGRTALLVEGHESTILDGDRMLISGASTAADTSIVPSAEILTLP